jgi:hypothetical protein
MNINTWALHKKPRNLQLFEAFNLTFCTFLLIKRLNYLQKGKVIPYVASFRAR